MTSLCYFPAHAQIPDDVFDWPTCWTAAITQELFNSLAVALLAQVTPTCNCYYERFHCTVREDLQNAMGPKAFTRAASLVFVQASPQTRSACS